MQRKPRAGQPLDLLIEAVMMSEMMSRVGQFVVPADSTTFGRRLRAAGLEVLTLSHDSPRPVRGWGER